MCRGPPLRSAPRATRGARCTDRRRRRPKHDGDTGVVVDLYNRCGEAFQGRLAGASEQPERAQHVEDRCQFVAAPGGAVGDVGQRWCERADHGEQDDTTHGEGPLQADDLFEDGGEQGPGSGADGTE